MKLNSILILCISLSLALLACKADTSSEGQTKTTNEKKLSMNISLAQWSLHKSFFGPVLESGDFATFGRLLRENPDELLQGELHPSDFPAIAAGYGVSTIELVNTFYFSRAKDMEYWKMFKENCAKAGVNVGLIMCDALGDLGHADEAERTKAIENHYPWVDIAAFLGAKSIRVNAAGAGSAEEVAENAVKGLSKLAEYGKSKGINILVENHGGYSSNGKWLAGVMKSVNMDNVGTLPDFGNFCIERGPDGCKKEYDRYTGISELMPYAKGVSAKTHNFDQNGNESHSNYQRIMKIVYDSGFEGDIGIEYEGNSMSEEEGIKMTIALLKRVVPEAGYALSK